MSELATRVTELEVKLGFAEDLIDTLNQTVFRQQEQLDLLQRQLIELNRRVQAAEAHEQRDPSEELPPHY
jgi:SlyX protein